MLEKEVLRYVTENHILDGVNDVVLAVSGGVDSMALAHLVPRLFPDRRYTVAHLHHGLRAEADGDEALVREFAAAEGLAYRVARRDIAAIAAAAGRGVEEVGREERYAFFRSLGKQRILTAHHRDDQAETVLMRIVRGSGIKGVTAMAPLSGDVGRPFLTVAKDALIAYCEENEVPYREDASNADPAYTRNRLRLEVLPLLRQLNPDVDAALCRLAADAAQTEAYLSDVVAAAFAANVTVTADRVTVTRPDDFPAAIAGRLIRQAAAEVGVVLDRRHTEAILALAPAKELPLGDVCCYRQGDDRVFLRHEADAVAIDVALTATGRRTLADGTVVTGERVAKAAKGDVDGEGFFAASLFATAPPRLRRRRDGDFVRLKSGHRKKLSDVLIDAKIPRRQRDYLLVLAVEDRVLWIVGHRFFAAADDGGDYLRITIEPPRR